METEDLVIESIGIRTPLGGSHWPAHAHTVPELLSGITGTVTVRTEASVHVVPRGLAVWIPAGVVHDVRASPGNRLRCTWFSTIAETTQTEQVMVRSTPALLDDVLDHLGATRDGERRRRAEAFAIDLLTDGGAPAAGLPLPRSPWLVAVADALVADPNDRRTVEDWARACTVSVRTFTRRFVDETGSSFSTWRAELRLRMAAAGLEAGQDPGRVARAVGFESTAAFSRAFRAYAGVSPSAFARSSARSTHTSLLTDSVQSLADGAKD